MAEDGHVAPGRPRVQNEVLLTAGKTHDVMVRPPAAATGLTFAPGTFPVLDRSLSLSTANRPLGGMQGWLLINHAAAPTASVVTNGVTAAVPVPSVPGNLPAAIIPAAVADSFNVPFNAPISGDVTANDIGITRVTLGTGPQHGVLALRPDGTFTYTPTTGFLGADGFTYLGNGLASLMATVTLNVGAQGVGPAPLAAPDTYVSAIAGRLSVSRPGVLANDRDPSGYPLHAGTVSGSTCTSVTLNADGSFDATGAPPSCQFSYLATNSQGTPSAAALRHHHLRRGRQPPGLGGRRAAAADGDRRLPVDAAGRSDLQARCGGNAHGLHAHDRHQLSPQSHAGGGDGLRGARELWQRAVGARQRHRACASR